MTDPQLAAGPQDPQGRSVPAPNQAPVIPPVQSEYDHELAIRNIRNSLYSTAQQINQQYLLHMAAQGQMQQYQAQKIQEATGGDMNQELALLENGMAVTNVRLPETRQAYQDWFADVEQRMAGTPGGIPENYPTLKDKYQDFTELAARFDATKSALKQQVQENLANYRSALRTPAEIVAPFAHEATMGAIPTPGTRVEDLGRSLRRVIDSIHPEVPKYDPGTRRDADPNARGGQVKPRDPRKDKRDTILRELAQQEATDQVRQAVAEHPEMRESDASLFMQKVSGYLGMALPMSAAEGLGVKAVQGMAGAAKTAVGKVAQHIAGAGLGFAGYGAMQPIAEEQQRRIESLPPDKRDTAERAARIDNAVTMALAAPLWIAGGALGSKIGSSLLPGTIGKSLGGGIGSGAVFPAAAEAQDTLKAKAIENVPSLRDMAEAQLIAKPELQGPVRQMIVSVEAGDWTSFKDGLMRYAKEAAPGMVAFGAIGAVHGISTSAQSKMHAHAKEIISYTEELAARARLEADKVAGADKELAEQLKQGVDQKVEEVRDAMAGEPTREGELATAVGPEEAAQKIAETKDIAETDLVSVQEKPEEGAPAKSEPAAGETLPGGQTSEEALPGGPTREERLLTKQAERAAPEEKPAIEAQVAEKKAKRRKRDVEEGIAPQDPQKPKTYQEAQAERIQRQAEARGRYEADPTDRKSMADYMEAKASGSALR